MHLVDDAAREDLDLALGVWIRELRIVVIDAGHEKLAGADDPTYEAMIARIAWYEWGHALSMARASEDDVNSGPRLIDLAPPGVAELIRRAGDREREYTHELVAEIYALLMARRRRGQTGKPSWLDQELFDLVRRTTGWTT